MKTGRNKLSGIGMAGVLLSGLTLSGTSLRAADTEYYRHFDRACIDAMLNYVWTQLVPAVQARCDAAGQARPLISLGRWHQARDARFYTGAGGWTTAEDTAGLRLTPVLFRDADGNGRRSAAEYVWLDADADAEFDAGEAVLSGPGGAGRVGDHGRAFPERLYAADADADGAWDPGENVWQETAAADSADLAGLHATLNGLLGSYVNPLDEPAWNGGATFARTWTTGMLLTTLNQETLLSPPATLDDSFAAARSLEAWLRQAVGMTNLLLLRPTSAWSTRGQKKSAFACRGPYYELDCTWQHSYRHGSSIYDHEVCQDVLTLQWSAPASPAALGPQRTFAWRGDDGCWEIGEPYLAASAAFGIVRPDGEYCFKVLTTAGAWGPFEHTAGPTTKPWYLGSYQYEIATRIPDYPPDGLIIYGWASVAVASPPRNAFALSHSHTAGGAQLSATTVLPSSASVATLFAAEWAAAEWQTASAGTTAEVRAYRWESDSTAYWPDAHDTCISQEWQECTATLSPPAGAGVEVYIYITEKEGTPDLFAGKDTGRFWHWSTLAAGPGGPVDIPFAPLGFPTVPNPLYPGGDNAATTRQRFTVHSVLDYRGMPGFAPLPTPPGATPPTTVFGTQDLDTNRDDLTDVGADLVSVGPDTGAIAVRPEWTHPQVMIPLAVALWDVLPVHAFLCQGASDDGPNLEWLHPDAGEQPLAFSLHSRAALEQLLITPTVQRKIVTVVRPRGNPVAFEFTWDAAAGAFAALGFPLAPNDRRTYVLRDLTPADDWDASFELHFDSGVIHVYAGARLAEGALTRVRHVDGRAVTIGSLTDCAFNLNANTFSSPRCRGVLTWSGGLLRRIDYTWRSGSGTLGVDLAYAATPAGPWVTSLAKTIPELGVSHPGGFGFTGGPQALSFGSGVTVTRNGGSVTTVWPSGGALTQITTFNADGLPTRLETVANGSAHATDYHYAGGNSRYPANGAPGWSKLVGITHPNGSWERFAYDPASGWLATHIRPWGDAAPTDPESLCRVDRFGYDSALSAGDPAEPALLAERPRSVVTETLGVETARTYHAYSLASGRRTVRTRRCAAAGAAWGDAENLESLVGFNLYGPANVSTPSGQLNHTCTAPRDDRITLTETASSGQTVTRVVNALGQVLSYRCTEIRRSFPASVTAAWSHFPLSIVAAWRSFPLVTAEAWSGIDPFGRPVRTDHLDGTCELFDNLQWHGGPLQHTRTDGSVETFTYFPDGRVRTRTHYGVTTAFTYDALGNVVREQRSAGALAVQIRTHYDSQGRQTLFEDELGRHTITTYSGMDRTVVYPDGSFRIEEGFLDGTPKRRAGDAVSAERYEYGVDASGAWSCTRRETPGGFTDASSASTDPLGRTWQTARTLSSGPAQVMSTTFFDPQGRPCRRVDADGVTTLIEYNARNEVSRTAIDLDADGSIGAADRTSAYERQALSTADPHDGAEVTGVLRTSTGPDGALTESLLTESFAAADGWRSWVSVNGRLTHTATVLGAGPGQRTVTTTFPAGSARVEIYDQGLLRRVRSLDAHGTEIAAEAYEYDALRRRVRSIDGRTGVATAVTLDAAGQIVESSRSDVVANEEYTYDQMGRTTRFRQRGGGEIFYDYDPTGQLTRASGADTFPCDYLYDPRGLQTGLRTWQDSLAGTGDALTEWRYDTYSGRLGERRLDGTPVESYGYTAAGRLESLVHHLPGGAVTTTFSRDAAGDVTDISHSDGSAGVAVVRDTAGRPVQISDATGTRDLTWDRDSRIVSETLPQLPGGTLRSTYDSAGRRTALTLSLNGADLLTWTRAYDAAGRLESVSDGYCRARYEYLPGANLVERTICSAGETDRLSIERDWDAENRLIGILAQTPGAAPKPVASWQYSLDADGRRAEAVMLLADPADPATPTTCRWQYAYDPLGQLSAATCRNPVGGAVLAGRDFAYDYDDIGNRRSAGRRAPATAAGEECYAANSLNQYVSRIIPGAVYVSGMADADAIVTVNGAATARDGTAFHVRLPVDNSAGPVSLALAIRAAHWDTAKGLDLIAEASGAVSVPAASELLTAADQGGLAADSLRTCQWDINDRLTAVEEISSPPGTAAILPATRLEFTYDAQGRRVSKQVFRFVVPPTGGPASWLPSSETRFVYDNWTLVAEFAIPVPGASGFGVPPSGGPVLLRSYLWGLDLDGLQTGQPDGQPAQGVGGLIAISSHSSSSDSSVKSVPSVPSVKSVPSVPSVKSVPSVPSVPSVSPSSAFTIADANGSIAALVDADSAAGVLETVEYEPFGRILSRRRADAGPVSAQAEPLCPFGFSSRYLDTDSGLVYFGYRYYNPDQGRWLNRDPLQEQGGPNLYAYCQNDPVNQVDPLGLWAEGGHYYTVLYVAQAAGWSFEEALELAAYAQAPDEIGKYEAINSLPRTRAQERLHCLSGADAVPLRGRIGAVLAPGTGLEVAQTGVLLHVLGDAYSHSREVSYATGYRTERNTCGGETFEEQVPIWGRKEVCFPTFTGHVATAITRGCWGSEPDAIGRHPKLYRQYVEDLYSILCALRPNAPREQKGFEIENLFDLTGGDTFRNLDTWGGHGYNFNAEAEALFNLIAGRESPLEPGQKLGIRRPEQHRVEHRSTTWDDLRVNGWPGNPNAVIEGVMELKY